ncbi:unnamed protein product [Ectocarpus fasciculatus]
MRRLKEIMKPRWELGALLTAASFGTAGGYSLSSTGCSITDAIADGWCDAGE